MTTRVIQILRESDSAMGAEWQDIAVPFTDDIWDRIKNLKDGCKPIALRVISRTTKERLIEINAAGQAHERHAAYIAALDSGDEE